jgi:serine protease
MLFILLKVKQMQTQLMRLLFLSYVLLIAACSDSSDSKEESTDPEARSTINGFITLAANLAVDSDLNDINSSYEDNSLFSRAQTIQNITTIQGFVTKQAIQVLEQEKAEIEKDQSKLRSGRFYTSGDEYDYFQTSLVKGQTIKLQTINSIYSNPDLLLSGDLDLFLFDINYDIVAFSNTLNEVETITTPYSGNFYIAVQANKGASSYVLKLSQDLSNPALLKTTSAPPSKPVLDFVPNELIVTFSEQVSAASTAKSSLFSDMVTSHTEEKRPTLAKFPETSTAVSASSHTQHRANIELASLNHNSFEKFMTIQKLKAVQEQTNVSSASLNYRRYPLLTPSDTLYEQQWHYPAMNLPEAWDLTTGTPESGDVIVAVVDTGIYSSHPDLINKLTSGYDFISDPENSSDNDPGYAAPNSDIDDNPEDPGDGGDISSSSWHGTHVAGIIAAETNNDYGIAGVSWGAKIMPLRVLGKNEGTTYDIMQAVRFAAGLPNDSGILPDKPADIINLSLGGFGYNAEEDQLFSQVRNLGIIVVAAAGNENTSEPSFPASYTGVFSVSALDTNANPTNYSNYGSNIDIAAPGGDVYANESEGVLSTLVTDNNGLPQADFAFYEGTSMASPHVAGMFALMKAVYPGLTASTVEKLLKAGKLTDDLGMPGRDDYFGYGSANALKAVQEAIAIKNGATLPTISFDFKASKSFIYLTGSNVSELIITNEGITDARIKTVSSDSNWLKARLINNDDAEDKNLGHFSIIADSSALELGYYQGVITFDFMSDATNDELPSLNVYVQMDLTDSSNTSQAAQMTVKLYEQGTQNLVKKIWATNNPDAIDGSLKFTLDKIKAGSYDLYASTDIDSDNEECVNGEICAKYQSLDNPQTLEVGVDSITDIVISADLLHTLN